MSSEYYKGNAYDFYLDLLNISHYLPNRMFHILMPPPHMTLAKPTSGFLKLSLLTINII